LYIQNGKGIEKRLSNEATKTIIDNVIVPHFLKGKFYSGLDSGIKEIQKRLFAYDNTH